MIPEKDSGELVSSDRSGDNRSARLPCRGCLKDCKHYPICDGRLWRLPAAERVAGPGPTKGR